MSSEPEDKAPSVEDKRTALREVLESAAFVRAGQLQSFLRFICEMEIGGRGGELSEHRIGVEALGRPPGYSPAEDAAVRRRASDLREKLDEVYATELAAARLRIDLPKGRYLPRFVRVERDPLEREPAGTEPAPARRFTRGALVASFAAGALTTALLFWVAPALPRRPARTPGVIYEAEAAASTLGGKAVREFCRRCSGGTRVRAIGNNPANFVELNGVTVAATGDYPVQIDYLLNGSRSFFVSVNGRPGVELPVTGQDWAVPSTASLTVRLQAGHNQIRFYNEATFAPDLDRVVVPRS
jgi:hypothetical protein